MCTHGRRASPYTVVDRWWYTNTTKGLECLQALANTVVNGIVLQLCQPCVQLRHPQQSTDQHRQADWYHGMCLYTQLVVCRLVDTLLHAVTCNTVQMSHSHHNRRVIKPICNIRWTENLFHIYFHHLRHFDFTCRQNSLNWFLSISVSH